jgi:hypothetical protein
MRYVYTHENASILSMTRIILLYCKSHLNALREIDQHDIKKRFCTNALHKTIRIRYHACFFICTNVLKNLTIRNRYNLQELARKFSEQNTIIFKIRN